MESRADENLVLLLIDVRSQRVKPPDVLDFPVCAELIEVRVLAIRHVFLIVTV